MADRTAIEWTDATWNPVRGFTRCSEGCRNCFAERQAARFCGEGQPYHGFARRTRKGSAWTGRVELVPERLDQVLRWRRPRRIFVNSMSDLFHEQLPLHSIATVFGAMIAAHLVNGHVLQVLTKRSGRMREVLWLPEFWAIANARAVQMAMDAGRAAPDGTARVVTLTEFGPNRPPPGIILGISAENQDTADARIPDLVRTPAWRRFLSLEPLIGPIDLVGWGSAKAHPPSDETPSAWADFQWPSWVPAKSRASIEDFWREEWGRGPRAWRKDNHGQIMPATGARVGYRVDGHGWAGLVPALSPEAVGQGRYIHHWNNIGALLLDDGRVLSCSGSRGTYWTASWLQRDGTYRPNIHQAIVGGESGPKARPMHPDWVRSLRDQCQRPKIPFFFKQWGEWAPAPWKLARDPAETIDAYKERSDREAATHTIAPWPDSFQPLDHAPWSLERSERDPAPHAGLRRMGKRAAGALLDGVEHREFPKEAPQ